MLLAIPIGFAFIIALSIFAVEYADRTKAKRLAREVADLQSRIAQAEQRHAPRKTLYRRLVEIRRQQMESNAS